MAIIPDRVKGFNFVVLRAFSEALREISSH